MTDTHILVVEDDEALRLLACLWLKQLGYTAQGVESAGQALARLSRERFALLFTDIAMPGSMDGIALALRAKRDWPAMPVLLASSYGAHLLVDHELPGPLLDKPYTKNSLAAAVTAILPATSASG